MRIENLGIRKVEPTHTGEMLLDDFMPDYGLTAASFAEALRVSRQTVVEDLELERRGVVYPGKAAYPLTDKIQVIPLADQPQSPSLIICGSCKTVRLKERSCDFWFFLVTGLGGVVMSRGYLKIAECLLALSNPASRILEIYGSSSYRASGSFTYRSTHSDDGGFPDIAVPVRDTGENDDLAFLGCLCQNSPHQT